MKSSSRSTHAPTSMSAIPDLGHIDMPIAIAKQGNRLIVRGRNEGILRVYNLSTNELLHTLAGHTAAIETVAITGNGKVAVSGGCDYKIRIWDLSTGSQRNAIPLQQTSIESLAMTPDGKTAVFATSL